MGSQGSLAISDEEIYLAEPVAVNVKSTVGAGDSMVAVLALAIEKGYGLVESLQLASAAATASISKPGTQLATLSDLERYKGLVKLKRIGVD